MCRGVTKYYVVVVGERDQERFRRFVTGEDDHTAGSIPKIAGAAGVWAVGPSTSHDIWMSIRRGDIMLFAQKGSSFIRRCTVASKMTNKSIAVDMWGDSPRMREHKRIILFDSIDEIDEPFHKTCRLAGVSKPSMITNVYPFKDRVNLGVQTSTRREYAGIIVNSDDGPASRRTEVVTRLIRDTAKVRRLKHLYKDRCQVCGYILNVSSNVRYSEVHHLHPLGEGGDDDYSNMLVLCPTHHAEFDLMVIGVNRDGRTLVGKNGEDVGRLTMSKGHLLDTKNIKFHLEGMAEDGTS